MPDLALLDFHILEGNAAAIVEQLKTVHCVVTSPPYFNVKRYGDSAFEVGQEEDVDAYVNALATIFQRIPLHPEGSIWVNLADKRGKRGELLQVPKRFSIEMENRGFLLADDVVWAKIIDDEDGTTEGGCMTEPANGRLNGSGYECLFRFVKTPKVNEAWTDTCAIRIPRENVENSPRYLPKELMRCESATDGRNLHNVWRFQTGQTREKHYAVYPPELCERPIAMTCPMFVNHDGTLRRRVVEMVQYEDPRRDDNRTFGKYSRTVGDSISGRRDVGHGYVARKPFTKGWEPVGEFFTPGVVLDPFCGTGTTGEVALKLGRNFIGIELYKENADIAQKRCEKTIEWMRANGLNPFKLAQ